MSDWHDELELALLPLEDLRVDSVYMTFVISNAMSERGIFHQCRIGYAEDRLSRMTTAPHCWVEHEQRRTTPVSPTPFYERSTP